MTKSGPSPVELEFRVELLKERIYATLALLAVLLTINPDHTTTGRAMLLVAGTAFSLWLASLIAAQMSYRIVMQRPHSEQEASRHLASHSPLLFAAVLPLLSLLQSALGLLALSDAVNLAIGLTVFPMIVWSLLSAKAIRAKRLPTLVIAGIELLIGLAVVLLKIKLGH